VTSIAINVNQGSLCVLNVREKERHIKGIFYTAILIKLALFVMALVNFVQVVGLIGVNSFLNLM
jgi:hypothetical protein